MARFLLVLSLLAFAVVASAEGETATAVKSAKVLFRTTVDVDGTEQPVTVFEGDSPWAVAKGFGVTHKLDAKGIETVALYLKRVAASRGLNRRVWFHLPFYVTVGDTQKLMNLTVYENSDPKVLAEEIGKQYGAAIPEKNVEKLQGAIAMEIMARVQIRVPVDLSAQGVGTRMLLVPKTSTVDEAVSKFSKDLESTEGISLKPEASAALIKKATEQLAAMAAKREL